jgi:hypothetical protein
VIANHFGDFCQLKKKECRKRAAAFIEGASTKTACRLHYVNLCHSDSGAMHERQTVDNPATYRGKSRTVSENVVQLRTAV